MRPVRGAGFVLLVLLGVAARSSPASAAAPPALERGAGRELLLTRLPPLLGSEEVRRHLETGLTTTFAFEVRLAGTKARGGGRVDIRYELWDEVWLVTRLDAAGQAQRHRFAAFEQLEAWWRDLRLLVLRAPPGKGASPRAQERADVQLRMIPFSQSEQLDAQRWLSRSLAEESSEPGRIAGVRNEPADDLLQLLLATSIGRPPLLELRWKLAVPPSAQEFRR